MQVIHTDVDSTALAPAHTAFGFRIIALDGGISAHARGPRTGGTVEGADGSGSSARAADHVGTALVSDSLRASIGSHPSNDVVIDDRLVSRFHCELSATPDGVKVKDSGSRNGTHVDGVRVVEAHVRDGSILRIGNVAVRVELERHRRAPRFSTSTRFGKLIGESAAMRSAFATLEQAASSDATVLLEGETGTGKELAAESLHAASPRAKRPFVIVDCGSLPAGLVESELFGHERGAFTGAIAARVGAFEAANGGTIFLDEIGELPLEAQSRLLRVLESRTLQRVGANGRRPIDVRVVAATHRDLRAEVNERRFRGDLYHRLAVVRVTLPSLRERPEDLPVLVRHLLVGMRAAPEAIERLATPAMIARLRRGAWTGNVRELRNHLESALVLGEEDDAEVSSEEIGAVTVARAPIDLRMGFVEARRRALRDFERSYLSAMLAAHGGDVSSAAEAAGVDRTYVYRILRRQRGAAESE